MQETNNSPTAQKRKPSPELLTPANHVLILIDYEGQMGVPVKSISINDLGLNAVIIEGTSAIFLTLIY